MSKRDDDKRKKQQQKRRFAIRAQKWLKQGKRKRIKSPEGIRKKSAVVRLENQSANTQKNDNKHIETNEQIEAKVEKKAPIHRSTVILERKMDIFRFPIIDWNYRWQRPQQIAVQFAKDGHRVYYFSLETTQVPDKDATYEKISQLTEIKPLRKNVWSVKLCSHNPVYVYRYALKDPLDKQYLLWSIESLKEQHGIDHTLSIIDLPFWAGIVFELENNKVIYDCMDEHSGFSNVSDELLAFEPEIIDKSDMIIASSSVLHDKVKARHRATTVIRNAVDYPFFSQPPIQMSSEVTNVNGPVIGYFGTIADWFDMELIVELARRNESWRFVLIGHNYTTGNDSIKLPENIRMIGEVPYTKLTKYLYGFDACVIPFKINKLTLATNPVKVYEYLASGRPVIATRLPELEKLNEYVTLARNVDEFEQGIRQALGDQSNEKIAARKEFAAKHTWRERYIQLMEAVKEHLYPKVSVVIVTNNLWSLTKQCLESLYRNSCYPNLEVIVVDNASTDETKASLSGIYHPSFKLLLLPNNMGFSHGNNFGCRIATGEILVLLNNDTIVPQGWIHRLIQPLMKQPELGMTGPMTNKAGNDQMLDLFAGNANTGADPDWLKEFYALYKGGLRYTDLLGFFCVAIKRKVYEEIGPLDTGYAIGMFEDDDYCERVKKANYKMAIVEDAFVYHYGSASFQQMPSEQYKTIFEKNKQLFVKKWGRTWREHQRPASMFLDVTDAETFVERLRSIEKKCILLRGINNWPFASSRILGMLARQYTERGEFIIAIVSRYYGKEITGIRKAGPVLYLTSNTDLFKHAKFDQVLGEEVGI